MQHPCLALAMYTIVGRRLYDRTGYDKENWILFLFVSLEYCSHGTFPHFSPQVSHLCICYYYQNLHYGSGVRITYTWCAR